MGKIDILKPAADKSVLFFLAGLVWFCAGGTLLGLAYSWLADVRRPLSFMYFGVGAAAALLIHRFGLQRIAAKNINRILHKADRQCVFSFFSWRSYMLIVVMITIGKLLRHSAFPKPYLSILYTGIGLALMLSSFKYLRVFVSEIRCKGQLGKS